METRKDAKETRTAKTTTRTKTARTRDVKQRSQDSIPSTKTNKYSDNELTVCS